MGKGGKWGGKEALLGGVGAQCRVQMMFFSCVLETCMILQTNVTPINST